MADLPVGSFDLRPVRIQCGTLLWRNETGTMGLYTAADDGAKPMVVVQHHATPAANRRNRFVSSLLLLVFSRSRDGILPRWETDNR